MGIYTLSYRFGTSKGADTYGYTTCTIKDANARGACSGGGYDLLGTALGKWMEKKLSTELLVLATQRAGGTWDSEKQESRDFCQRWDHQKGKLDANYRENALPGLTLYTRNGKPDGFGVDGGVGFRCMVDILAAIGYRLRDIPTNFNRKGGRKDSGVFILEPMEAAQAA